MVKQEIVSAGETISELKKKAADCEEKAKQAAEPEAEKLREEGAIPRVDRTAAIRHMAFVASRLMMSVMGCCAS